MKMFTLVGVRWAAGADATDVIMFRFRTGSIFVAEKCTTCLLGVAWPSLPSPAKNTRTTGGRQDISVKVKA